MSTVFIRKLFPFAGLLATVISASAATPAPPSLSMQIGATTITTTGATANATVLFVGCTRRFANYATRRVFHLSLSKSDATGAATYDLASRGDGVAAAVPRDSFWIATDVTSGRYGAVSPDGVPLRRLNADDDLLPHSNNGQLNKLLIHSGYVQVVLVRPGAGVWARTAGDGGPGDRDGVPNGRIESGPDDMTAIDPAYGPPPKKFDKDDVVIIINEDAMTFLVTRVGEK
jgi:hypothetical protein